MPRGHHIEKEDHMEATNEKTKEPPSVKCDICFETFSPEPGYRPCANCGRNYCPAHRETQLVSEITEELSWCVRCGDAYRTGGMERVKQEQLVPLRTHGS